MFLSTFGKKEKKRNRDESITIREYPINSRLSLGELNTSLVINGQYNTTDRISYRKQIVNYDSSKIIADFLIILKSDNDFQLCSSNHDVIEQISLANNTLSIMETEEPKAIIRCQNEQTFDISIVDVPFNMGERYCAFLGSLFYYFINASNLKNMFENKILKLYPNYPDRKFRNIILILCHNNYSVYLWKNMIQKFLEKYKDYFFEKDGKTFRVFDNLDYCFDLAYGKFDELCFVIQLADKKKNIHTLGCSSRLYKIINVVTIEDSFGLESSFFNKNQEEFIPTALHYVYLSNYYNRDHVKMLDLNNIRKNSVMAKLVSLEKFENQQEKAVNIEATRDMHFRVFHSYRHSSDIYREAKDIMKLLELKEVTLEYVSSNLSKDIVEFNDINMNFDILRNTLQTYHIILPESFRTGFLVSELEKVVTDQINSETNTTRKEKMTIGLERFTDVSDCCICYDTCDLIKKQKVDEEENSDICVLLCCLNKIHTKCMKFSSCPFCRIDSIEVLRSNRTDDRNQFQVLEQDMNGFLSYLNTNPYSDRQKNSLSLISLLQQVLNCLLDYVKTFPIISSVKLLIFCKQAMMNKFYIKLNSLLPLNYKNYIEINRLYGFDYIDPIQSFENSTHPVNILVVECIKEVNTLVKIINMGKLDMILDLGDCIDLSTKEKIFHGVVSIDRRKSKQFCYLSIKKKKNK